MNENELLNNLDDDEFGLGTEPQEGQQNLETDPLLNSHPVEEPTDPGLADTDPLLDPNQNSSTQESIVEALLSKRNINPDSVKFENENGEIVETKFSDLPLEDQMEILDSSEPSPEDTLSDDEIELINEVRNGSLTANEYRQYLKQQGIQEYLQSIGEEPQTNTSIDKLSDDELFIADLKSRVPDMSDEDALAKLEAEKTNPDLFKKEITGIRDIYTRREQEEIALRDQAEAQKLEADQKAFVDTIIDTIDTNASIDLGDNAIELSDMEKDNIASFILDTDAAGNRHIAKAFNDPKTLVGMSWYALYGQDAFNQLSSYYKQKITEAARSNYSKGYTEGKSGVKPTTVIKQNNNNNNNNRRYSSINDVDV